MFLYQPDLVATDENGLAFLSQDLTRCLGECSAQNLLYIHIWKTRRINKIQINFDQVFSNDFQSITFIDHLEIKLSFLHRKPTFRDHGKNHGKARDVTLTINWSSSLFKGYE